MFKLAEVRLLRQRGADPLLDRAGAAALCYVVRDDCTCPPDQAQGPVCVAFPPAAQPDALGSSCGQDRAAAEAAPEGVASGRDNEKENTASAGASAGTDARSSAGSTSADSERGQAHDGSTAPGSRQNAVGGMGFELEQEGVSAAGMRESADVSGREAIGSEIGSERLGSQAADAGEIGEVMQRMQPETERAAALYVATECRALLEGAATSACQDQALLGSLGGAPLVAPEGAGRPLCAVEDAPADIRSTVAAEQKGVLGGGAREGSGGGSRCGGQRGKWRERRHLEMALQYRLQRKLLLARVADDLAAQVALLS